jgi:hypothetical protein
MNGEYYKPIIITRNSKIKPTQKEVSFTIEKNQSKNDSNSTKAFNEIVFERRKKQLLNE